MLAWYDGGGGRCWNSGYKNPRGTRPLQPVRRLHLPSSLELMLKQESEPGTVKRQAAPLAVTNMTPTPLKWNKFRAFNFIQIQTNSLLDCKWTLPIIRRAAVKWDAGGPANPVAPNVAPPNAHAKPPRNTMKIQRLSKRKVKTNNGITELYLLQQQQWPLLMADQQTIAHNNLLPIAPMGIWKIMKNNIFHEYIGFYALQILFHIDQTAFET